MIDYVKILFRDIDVIRLLSLSCLDFKTEVSESTGELSSKKVADYKFCKITILNNNIVLFTGSIHKLWNELQGIKAQNHRGQKYRGFNGNMFTINNIIEVPIK